MKHAPRGPMKGHADPSAVPDPLAVPSGLKRGVRCSAHSKRTGKPCTMPAIAGGTVCRMHGGSAPQVKASARERLMALQPKAIQTLDALLSRDEFPTVQLGAAKDVLDRTEGKAAESVQVTGANQGPIEIVVKVPWAVDDAND